MRLVDADTVAAALVASLGLDCSIHAPSSDEVLAGAIRRVAAMSCPCSRKSVVRAVAGSLEAVIATDDLAGRVDEMIEQLIAHGDLTELRETREDLARTGSLLHVAPPAFVRRRSGSVLLLGVAPDEIFPLPGELGRHILHRGHVRVLEEDSSGNLPAYLADFGLLEVAPASWQRAPPRSMAADLLRTADAQLDTAARAGNIEDLRILDWSTPVDFYRGRWGEPARQTGRFLARRPQSYGLPLWCYVELEMGRPGRLLDLPLDATLARGCDEGWRLQAAIDASRGHPQRFRLRQGQGATVLDFFSPLPRWADRRFTAIGEVVPPSRCLFSRSVPMAELEEELEYVREELWLEEMTEG